MVQQKITTKNPKRILQVYHNYLVYHKDQKRFSDRRESAAWRTASGSPYLEDNHLVLSKNDYDPRILSCDLIILNDFNSATEPEAIEQQNKRWNKGLLEFEEKAAYPRGAKLKRIQYLSISSRPANYEIFQLRKSGAGIEVHLVYDLFEIGEPKRENFRICKLEQAVPVEIKINGKLDYSLTRGRERTYKEHSYIFQLCGEVDEFQLSREPFEGIRKQIPSPEKSVNLMKRLY